MNFKVFSDFAAVAGPGRQPRLPAADATRSLASVPPLGRPNFAREPAFHGEIIPVPRPICVAWKWEGETTLQIALLG